MAELDARSDGRLSSLRSQSIKMHQQRFRALLDQPDYRELYDFCAAA